MSHMNYHNKNINFDQILSEALTPHDIGIRKWLVWNPTDTLGVIADNIDKIQQSKGELYHGGPYEKLEIIRKTGRFISNGEGIVHSGRGAYVASDPTLAGAFALRAFKHEGSGVILVLDKNKLPDILPADNGNFTVNEIPSGAIKRVINLANLVTPRKKGQKI